MIMNVEQSSFSGVMLNVSTILQTEKIIRNKVFSKLRINNTFHDFDTRERSDIGR